MSFLNKRIVVVGVAVIALVAIACGSDGGGMNGRLRLTDRLLQRLQSLNHARDDQGGDRRAHTVVLVGAQRFVQFAEKRDRRAFGSLA